MFINLKKIKILSIIVIAFSFYTQADDSGLQKRTTVHRKKVCDVQAEIVSVAETMLTTLTALISSLSEEINHIIKKMKALALGNDPFFSKRKAHQLEQYKTKLEARMKKLQVMYDETKQDLADLHKNFDL
jgi:uracil DNA glycosylase